MILRTHIHFRISLATLAAFIALASCQDTLGPLPVSKENITLSGFSSGGTMAQMLQFAYSSLFRGVAVFSHTFYRCGPPVGDIDEYDRYCTTLFNLTDSEMWDTAKVHEDIKEYLSMSLIEDPSNLKDKRLYVYSGLRNLLFTPSQSLKILQVYEPYIQNPAAVKTRVQDAVQLLPSDSYGTPCNQSAESTDFIGNCGFSGVTEALNFLLDASPTEAFQRSNVTLSSNLSTFDQTPFTKDLQNHNMDTIGYYYVPSKCQPNGSSNTPCLLHLYFHGCLTGHEFNGPRHVQNSGLLEYAERNNVVIIFPQAKSSVPNPIGCWDTFGVAGKYYATQQGPQVTAIKRMLDAIVLGGQTDDAMTTTMTPSPAPEESTKSVPASSRLSAQRSNPPKGYPQKKPPVTFSRKLTYLPPPPSKDLEGPQPLRRSGAYKAVKYAFLRRK